MNKTKFPRVYVLIFLIISLILIFIFYIHLSTINQKTTKANITQIYAQDKNNTIGNLVSIENVLSNILNINLNKSLKEIDNYHLEKYIDEHSEKIRRFFEIYKAKMIGTEKLIVKTALECQGDYRIIVGIAGIESGLGRSPVGGYNPFGYLDGKYYNSFEEAIRIIGCDISQRFIKPCEGNLDCIVKRYGVPPEYREHWKKNVDWFMNQVV